MTTITSITCPQCNKLMFVNLGNTDDMTVGDVEAVRCPYCIKCFFLEDFVPECFEVGVTADDLADDGYKTPNEAFNLEHIEE